jgi:aryl-alcohol dehydrogenase-like predicted oxidoreductase
VPFDEGSLTGTLTKSSTWPANDWRSTYFVPENLSSTVDHVERLRPAVPDGMTMPDVALRFILSNPDVTVVIPGMRKPRHVRANIATSDAAPLPTATIEMLREHRWDRSPTDWSQ